LAIVAWRSLLGDLGSLTWNYAIQRSRCEEQAAGVDPGGRAGLTLHPLPTGGVSVVDMVRTKKAGSQETDAGTLRGKIRGLDPNGWKPMTDHELNGFLAERD